jgi:hypothetical protein
MRKLAKRLNATVRPSGETAGEKSPEDFIGGALFSPVLDRQRHMN